MSPTRESGGLAADDRAISQQVSYVLTITIATILIAGLVTTTAGFVRDQSAAATEAELRVAGDRLAAELMAADRLARQDSDATFTIDPDVPRRAGGNLYLIDVQTGTGPDADKLVLQSGDQEVTVTIPMRVSTPFAEGETTSGDLVIVREGGQIKLEDRT